MTLEANVSDVEGTARGDARPPGGAPAPWLETVMIPLSHLVASPTNPRKRFDPEKMKELEGSMWANGFSLSTLLVRPIQESLRVEEAGEGQYFLVRGNGAARGDARPPGETLGQYGTVEEALAAMKGRENMFEVVAGERRLKAALAVGIVEAPCIVRPMTDEEVLRFQLIENIQRDDLTPLEEASGFQRLLALRDGDGKPVHTVQTLHETTGRSERHIQRMVKLCTVIEDPALGDFAKALEDGVVSPTHGLILSRVVDPKARAKFAKEILAPRHEEAPLTKRQAELVLQRDYMVDTRTALFDPKDAGLVPVEVDSSGTRVAGGSCEDCPQLLANAAALMEMEIPTGQHRMCCNPSCFARKGAAEWGLWQESKSKSTSTSTSETVRALSAAECRRLYQYGDQLNWDSGYVDLAQRPDSQDLRPGVESPGTWRQLVKGSEIEVVWARDKNGREHELVSRELAVTAAVANGYGKEFKEVGVKKSGDRRAETGEGGDGTYGTDGTDGERGSQLSTLNSQQEAAEETLAERKRREKEEYEGDVRDRLEWGLSAALAEKADVRPPDGFWLFAAEFWEVDLEAGFDQAGARRGWDEGWSIPEKLGGMSEVQRFGLYLEAYFLGLDPHLTGLTPGRERLLGLFGVNVKQVEANVRAALKVERDAEKAEAELLGAMQWDRRREKVDEFEWNSQNVCATPDVCVIVLPGGKKAKVRCEITAARSEKGWHFGYRIDAAKEGGTTKPVAQNEAAYGGRNLALKIGLKEAAGWFKKKEVPDVVKERLVMLAKVLEKEGVK